MWHEWNVNAADIMMTWFALYVNLVMSCLACAMHPCMVHMLYVELACLSIQVACHAHKLT